MANIGLIAMSGRGNEGVPLKKLFEYASKANLIRFNVSCVLAVLQGLIIPIMIHIFGIIFDNISLYSFNVTMKRITKINDEYILKKSLDFALFNKSNNTTSYGKEFPILDIDTIKQTIYNRYGEFILENIPEFVTVDTISKEIQKYSILLGIATIISFFLSFTFIYLLNYASSDEITNIRSLIYQYLLNENIAWHEDKKKVEKVLSDYNIDLILLQEGIGPSIGLCYFYKTVFIINFIIPFLIGFKFTLIMISSSLIVILVIISMKSVMNYFMKNEAKCYESTNEATKKSLYNFKTTVIFGNEDKEINNYISKITSTKFYTVMKSQSMGICMGISSAATLIIYVTLSNIGKSFILKSKLSSGEIIQIFLYIISVFATISFYINCKEKTIQSQIIAKNVLQMIEHLKYQKILNSIYIKSIKDFQGEIEFYNVHFTYPNGPKQETLKGVTFHCQPGQTIAIVGEPNSGKSTLFRLLEKYYVCKEEIRIDNHRIVDIETRLLHNQIGLITREPILFNNISIAENIAIVRPSASFTEIENAARLANAHDFIMELPDGYKTQIREMDDENKDSNGIHLSIGQKQLICIARTLLLNPKILLIDEATTDLESPYKEMAQSALESATFDSKRTSLIITYQIDIIKKVDNIIVMSDGKVVESGTHDELMNKHTQYFNLVKCGKIGNENIMNNSSGDTKSIISSDMDNSVVCGVGDISIDSKSNFLIKDLNIDNTTSLDIKDDIKDDGGTDIAIKSKDKTSNRKSSKIKNFSYTTEYEKNKKHFIPWKYIISFNKSYWFINTLGILGSIIMGFSRLLCSIIVAGIFSMFCEHIEYRSSLFKMFRFSRILPYIGCGFIIILATYFSIACFAYSGDCIALLLRKEMFKSIFKQEVAYIESFRINEKNNALTDKLNRDNAFIHYINVYLSNIISVISSIFFIFICALVFNRKLFLSLLIFAPVIYLVTIIYTKVISVDYGGNRVLYENSSKYIANKIRHIRMIHALDIKDYCLNIYNQQLRKELKQIKSKNFFYSIIAAFGIVLQPSICFIGFSFGFHFLKEGSTKVLNMLTVNTIILFAVTEISRISYNDFSNFTASIEIFINDLKIINRKSKIDATNSFEGVKDISLKGRITFNNNVTFNSPSYPDVPLLHLGLDKIEIPEKKTVAIIGGTNSGNRELLQLIPRLYDIQCGEILIDDTNLKDYNVKWLRQQIGYIESKPNIYNDTFENNIRIGKRNASKEEIIEAAKMANIHNYIISLPEGYNYQINDTEDIRNGIKYKIAIARALIRQPSILLIDKPIQTSSGEESEIIFQKFINNLIQKHNHERTIIIASDQLFLNIDKVDIIMVMKEGKIIEKGSHDELMALKKEYYNMNLPKENNKYIY